MLVAALLVVMPLCGCAREFAADFDRRLDAFLDSQDREASDGEHACVDFSQMSYERPDMDELFAAIDVLERSAKFGDAAVEEACRTVDTLYTSAYTQYSLVSIYQSLDVNDETYYDESIRLYDELSEADRRINAALVSLIDDGCRDALEEYFGEEYVEDVLLNERLLIQCLLLLGKLRRMLFDIQRLGLLAAIQLGIVIVFQPFKRFTTLQYACAFDICALVFDVIRRYASAFSASVELHFSGSANADIKVVGIQRKFFSIVRKYLLPILVEQLIWMS